MPTQLRDEGQDCDGKEHAADPTQRVERERKARGGFEILDLAVNGAGRRSGR